MRILLIIAVMVISGCQYHQSRPSIADYRATCESYGFEGRELSQCIKDLHQWGRDRQAAMERQAVRSYLNRPIQPMPRATYRPIR